MIKAHISEGPFGGDSLQVFLVDHQPGALKRLLTKDGDHWRWVELDPHMATIRDPVDPTFELPWDSGRALLDALTQYYRGSEDTRALRRDYDAERKRVDDLTRTMSDVLRAVANAAQHP
jgi:hypothetical protein